MQQLIDGTYQGGHFFGHVPFRNGAQVATFALANSLLQIGQGANAAAERKPDQQNGHGQDDELRQDHALDDLGRQLRSFVQGFGHLHHRAPIAAALASRHQRQRDVGHTNRLITHHVIAKTQLVGAR